MLPTLYKRLRRGFSDLFYVWKQEFATTLRDQGVLIFFVLVPLAYPLAYSFIYHNETVREVPAAVVDLSRSALSRDYVRRVDATPEVSIVSHCADMEEAKELLRQRKAYGIVFIPATFSSDLAGGRQTQVSLFCDMSGLLYYKSLLLANTNVSLEMNARIKIARAGLTTARAEAVSAQPLRYTDVALFNPTSGFAVFLIPAVLMLILQQTLLLGIGLSAGTARERNPGRGLLPVNRHYRGLFRVVLGKSLSYFMVYVLVSFYVLCVVPRLFSLVQLGAPGTLTLFVLPYLAACIFFAMTASVLVRNRETCFLLFVFTSVPLLFLSGVSWPGASMPAFWRYFSYLFPSTFGINGFVRINSMGATLADVAVEYRSLWLQAGAYFCTACWVYYRQVRRR
ncbi:MAG: ABC transporter permease [Prevotellaceae bacterium]|jgi:ABC-2 type transport system permease protein|nr:ABC transporter permease [Prevotellaceae bacterium]